MGPPTDPPPASTGPPDRQTLQLLERHLAGDSLVVDTEFEPDSYEPRLLRVQLADDQYPPSTNAARLDVRWFTTEDFSIHYVETRIDGSQWECRWDRHPNEHNARAHVHHPPDGSEVTDLSLPSLHPLELYATVLDALDQRLAARWEAE